MYDAIIIHIRGLPNDWPSKRSQEQRYIMLSIDAPIKLYEYRHLEKLAFNWTMTYRLDSDFPVPYAWIDRVLPLPAPQGSTLLQRFIASHGKKAVTQGPNLAENKVHYFQTPLCLKITEKSVIANEAFKFPEMVNLASFWNTESIYQISLF